jgi:hypothetical protein
MSDLTPYRRGGGGSRPPSSWSWDRPAAKAAREVENKAAVKATEQRAAIALGRHLMQGMVGLDEDRKQLAGNDQAQLLMLAEIQKTVFQQGLSIQRDLFSDRWF